MSTLAYAAFTNQREAAVPGTSDSTSSPGLSTYVDALAALVPAEVLTLHGLILTVIVGVENGVGTLTDVDRTTLGMSFWGLVLLCLPLFAVPRIQSGHWDRLDYVRVLIAPLAFIAWTMLQPTTAFDAAFMDVPRTPRTVIALFMGAILGGITAILARQADAKPVK